MSETLNVADVVTFLELNKSRAELSFKLAVSVDEDEKANIRKMLESTQEKISKIYNKIEKAAVTIAIPNESAIAALNDTLSTHSPQEILEAMKKKEGELYDTLSKRGEMSKKNFANRENIAKLSIFIAGFPKEVRDAIVTCVRAGAISSNIPLINVDEPSKKKLLAFLGRIGIKAAVEENMLVSSEGASYEVEMELTNKKVWVPATVCERLNNNISNITQISQKIQLKNAVRQIKEFSEDEEKEFASMQDQYLKLLKEQDELLADFFEEGKISRQI
jgi:hypothetical protein